MRRCLIMVSPISLVDYSANNVYANFRNKYGVGPEDFGVYPYIQPYPQAVTPLPPKNYKKEGFLKKLIRMARS